MSNSQQQIAEAFAKLNKKITIDRSENQFDKIHTLKEHLNDFKLSPQDIKNWQIVFYKNQFKEQYKLNEIWHSFWQRIIALLDNEEEKKEFDVRYAGYVYQLFETTILVPIINEIDLILDAKLKAEDSTYFDKDKTNRIIFHKASCKSRIEKGMEMIWMLTEYSEGIKRGGEIKIQKIVDRFLNEPALTENNNNPKSLAKNKSFTQMTSDKKASKFFKGYIRFYKNKENNDKEFRGKRRVEYSGLKASMFSRLQNDSHFWVAVMGYIKDALADSKYGNLRERLSDLAYEVDKNIKRIDRKVNRNIKSKIIPYIEK